MDTRGDNYIHNITSRGLYAYYSSNVFLGQDMCGTNGGHNQFVNNNYHIYAIYYCTITAENNWWGCNPPSSSDFYTYTSTIDYTPYLTSGPLLKITGPPEPVSDEDEFDESFGSFMDSSLTEAEVLESFDTTWPLMRQLQFARNLIALGFPESAAEISNDILQTCPDSSEAWFALDLLWQSGRKYSAQFEQYKNTLDSLSLRKSEAEIYEEADLLLSEYEDESTLSKYTETYKNYSSDLVASHALFHSFNYYLFEKEDRGIAYEVLTLLENNYPESGAAIEARFLYDSSLDTPAEQIVEIPREFVLYGNYPNPFNPSTTFKFGLPVPSNVKITLYNIIGQKIRSITSENLSAGIHKLTWNGKNENGIKLPSGMYIYRFEAQSLSDGNHKMIKSDKIILLK
jgi:hypothetical protein